MPRASKLGTIVRLPDGREGTTVYNSLIGVGIKWGRHNPDPKDFEGTDGNTVSSFMPEGFKWKPDALLREPLPSFVEEGWDCVGEEFDIVEN